MRLAQQFAIESDQVTADCIEATEFPDLVTYYRVQAVPRTVINAQQALEGALPESYFLDAVLNAVQPAEESPKDE